MKNRLKKCETCNKEMKKATGCMTCAEESTMKAKVKKVMHEFKEHELHSKSHEGPLVTNREQAIAIALSEGVAKLLKKAINN